MSKIFGIGLPRTGTASLCETFVILGYNARHYPKYISRAERFDALVDTPICNEFEFLDNIYPGSKFILSTRNLNDWLKSCEDASRRFRWHNLKPDGRCGPEVYKSHMDLFGTTSYNKYKFIDGYYRHYDRVINYFGSNSDKLLIYDINDNNKMERICEFLGKKIPKEDFPHRNMSKK